MKDKRSSLFVPSENEEEKKFDVIVTRSEVEPDNGVAQKIWKQLILWDFRIPGKGGCRRNVLSVSRLDTTADFAESFFFLFSTWNNF